MACLQGTVEAFNGAAYYWAGKENGLQWFTSVPFGLNTQGYTAWYQQGGGLALWERLYPEAERADDLEASAVFEYRVGDLLLLDSYRLHQIQPFDGDRDRISITLHASEIVHGAWDSWF